MRSLPYCSELQTLLSLEMDQVIWILNLTVAEPHKTLGKLINYTIKALHLASSQKFVFTSQMLKLIKVLAPRLRVAHACISAPTEVIKLYLSFSRWFMSQLNRQIFLKLSHFLC